MANITLASIKTRLVARNFLDSTYTDDIFLEDCHYIAQDIWSSIQYERKWTYNWDIWLADTVAFQDEYTRPPVTSTTVWADYLDSVSVAFSSDTYDETGSLIYVPCRVATTEEQKDWIRLLEEQSQEDPIYFYSDGSIFVAPDIRSTEAWTNRLRLTGVRSLASGWWTTATTETSIKLPIFMFDVLFYGLKWKSSEFKWRDAQVINNDYVFYRNELNRAIKKMNLESSETMVKRIETDDIILS